MVRQKNIKSLIACSKHGLHIESDEYRRYFDNFLLERGQFFTGRIELQFLIRLQLKIILI